MERGLIQSSVWSGSESLYALGEIHLQSGPYRVRLAETVYDHLAAYRLRFIVFNLELREGLESAFENGLDTDEFDDLCDHLIVEQIATGRVVGTYRLQTGIMAAQGRG